MPDLNDAYYDSLLDDPVDNQNDDSNFEPEVDPSDNEPLVPDQPDSLNDTNSNPDQNTGDEDVMTSYLKTRGIVDPTKIQFETEDGNTEERD